ncbi:MAG: DUF3179 domain-containing protein [Planctomycetes bacterium]|nr:DUF3179 domain-containing protein [Planctomycetota bacterium]
MDRDSFRRVTRCAILFSLGLESFTGGCARPTESPQSQSGRQFETMVRRFETLGPLVQIPQTLLAADVSLDDSAWVIGVTINGRHRAYRMNGMKLLETHVVNDYFEQTPVTVTYCDLRACVRAFTSPSATGDPLQVRVAGFDDREGLLLELQGQVFAQAGTAPPLDLLQVETMTWKDWKSAHPDTDIYLGREPDPEAQNNRLRNLTLGTTGIRLPQVVSAAGAPLIDAARVIGVSIHGKPRAYRITALSDPRAAVLNDLIDGVPVTITYNHWNDCVRVLTQTEHANQPLAIDLHGWDHGTLQLSIAGQVVSQQSDLSGFEDLDSTTTTWKEWKAAHPDTDVYTGMGLVTQAAD